MLSQIGKLTVYINKGIYPDIREDLNSCIDSVTHVGGVEGNLAICPVIIELVITHEPNPLHVRFENRFWVLLRMGRKRYEQSWYEWVHRHQIQRFMPCS